MTQNKTADLSICRKSLILNGAQGRNRTTDTLIFSQVLYRLSYLGTLGIDVPREGF